ncbi:MAG: FIMAH domain-containing protein [bacterium]
MRTRYLPLIPLAVAFALAVVAPAYAEEEHDCGEEMSTVMSLHHCVEHAIEMGHISNAGVGNALLAKIDAAQAAVDRQKPSVAVNKLRAFINQVEAQAGRHIEEEHAGHMIMHAEMVIDALSP